MTWKSRPKRSTASMPGAPSNYDAWACTASSRTRSPTSSTGTRSQSSSTVGALGSAGALLVVLGTLCSRNAWLAAGAMFVVGFVVLYAGVLGGYFAAGGTSAILAFVLPVTIPAPFSAVPARLEGWALAAGVGI